MSEEDKDRNAAAGYSGVGTLLKASRQRCDESVKHVAQVLRIRQLYIEAIEEGRFKDLPGPTYATGFVRAYAEHLGLDSEEVVRRFKSEASGMPGRNELVFPSPVKEGRIPGGSLMMAALVVAAAVYAGWHFMSSRDRKTAEPVSDVPGRLAATAEKSAEKAAEKKDPPPAAPGQAEPAQTASAPQAPLVAAAPAEPAAPPQAAPTPAEPEKKVEAAAPAPEPEKKVEPEKKAEPEKKPEPEKKAEKKPDAKAPRVFGQTDGDVRIAMKATNDTWIKVTDAKTGEVVSQRILKTGDLYRVPIKRDLLFSTGSAGALEVSVDGQTVPKLGRSGDVKKDIPLDIDKLKAGTASPAASPPKPAEAAKPRAPEAAKPRPPEAAPAAQPAAAAPAQNSTPGESQPVSPSNQ